MGNAHAFGSLVGPPYPIPAHPEPEPRRRMKEESTPGVTGNRKHVGESLRDSRFRRLAETPDSRLTCKLHRLVATPGAEFASLGETRLRVNSGAIADGISSGLLGGLTSQETRSSSTRTTSSNEGSKPGMTGNRNASLGE